MEKTMLGLLVSTPINRARPDELVCALLTNHRDLYAIQRKGLRMPLALKSLLYTYCPYVLTIGILVQECNWEGSRGAFWTIAKHSLEMSLLVMPNPVGCTIPCLHPLTACSIT